MRNKPYPIYQGIELKKDFYSVLSYCREQYGTKCAISFRRNKSIEKRSFEELLADSLKLASYISNLGYHGRNIAIVSPNSYEWVVAFFAIQFCGNIVVPVNCNLPAEERNELLRKADVCAAFVSASITVSSDACDIYDIDSVVQNICDMAEYSEVSVSEAPSMIFFTSGSTGYNKGVLLTQLNICYDVFCMTK